MIRRKSTAISRHPPTHRPTNSRQSHMATPNHITKVAIVGVRCPPYPVAPAHRCKLLTNSTPPLQVTAYPSSPCTVEYAHRTAHRKGTVTQDCPQGLTVRSGAADEINSTELKRSYSLEPCVSMLHTTSILSYTTYSYCAGMQHRVTSADFSI